MVRENELIIPTFNIIMISRDTFLTLLIHGPKGS